MRYPVEWIDGDTCTDGDLLVIARWSCRIWPRECKTPEPMARKLRKELQAPAPVPGGRCRLIVVRDGPEILAHAKVFGRRVRTEQAPMDVLGLAGVFSIPEVRGRGLGRIVVRAAFDLVDRGAFPHCLFQTSKSVRGFYESMGARKVSNRITDSFAEQPDVCPFWDEEVMRYSGRQEWPRGTIDLCGPGY